MNKLIAYMGAALILVGLLQPITNLPQSTLAAAEVVTAKEVKPAETQPPVTASETPKAVTWQDNPNNCNLETQYIAEAAPFNCIDKPVEQASTVPTTNTAPSGGSCEEWISFIADKASARELIRRESGCDPNAVNPSSGACGVAQELPCGKSGCALGDGQCQVRWMNNYVISRYGGWSQAVDFHNVNNWY